MQCRLAEEGKDESCGGERCWNLTLVHIHTHKHTTHTHTHIFCQASSSYGPTQCPATPLPQAAPARNCSPLETVLSPSLLLLSHQSPRTESGFLRFMPLGLSTVTGSGWEANTPHWLWPVRGQEAMSGLPRENSRMQPRTWLPSNKGICLCGSCLHHYPTVVLPGINLLSSLTASFFTYILEVKQASPSLVGLKGDNI